jgi:DNA-binding beta-propeller fold protein YncE
VALFQSWKGYTFYPMPKLFSFRMLLSVFCIGVVSMSAGAQTLLVVNQGDSNLSVIDPVSARQVAAIAENTIGVHGHEVVVSSDGRTAYMPIYGSSGVGKAGIDGHQMLVIDLPSRKIIEDIDFGHEVRPHQPVLDPERGVLYVTTELDKAVTVIDLPTLKIVGTIPTGQEESHMLALSHDGRFGYTANVGPGTVSMLDMVGRKTVAVIPVSGKVQRISISNDDRLVFTSDQTKPQLAVIDTETKRVKTWVPLPGTGYGTASTPDGRWLLVAIPSTNQVAVVDLSSMTVVRSIEVPSTPQEILIPPGGKVAYVSCNTSGKVAAIDLAHWTVQKLIVAGKFADGLAWAK